MTFDTAAATEFIERYQRTFETFDVDAIARSFAFPLQVVGDAGAVSVVLVPDDEAWRPQLERILGAYRLVGVATSAISSLAVREVTPRITHATVQWTLRRVDASTVYDFTASYTLAETADGIRIVAIAHDESPKLAAALGR